MTTQHLSDLEIARQAKMLPIESIAEKIGLAYSEIECFGHYKAKITYEAIEERENIPNGKLVLMTALSPTPAGEGKTTTCIGLSDALNRIGKKTIVCLREPSLGPCFGIKGGAAGGGYAQVVPMEDINLHFTGDLHAITAAHNLLSAMLDNELHFGKWSLKPLRDKTRMRKKRNFNFFIRTRCRSRRKSKRFAARFTERTELILRKKPGKSWINSKKWALDACPSASPRRNIPFRQIRHCGDVRKDSGFRFAMSKFPPEQVSSLHWRAKS